MNKTVKIFCVFHVDFEEQEPILLQSFTDMDELSEFLFENEDNDYNFVVETTECSVTIPQEEDDLQ